MKGLITLLIFCVNLIWWQQRFQNLPPKLPTLSANFGVLLETGVVQHHKPLTLIITIILKILMIILI